MARITDEHRTAYYRGALLGLLYVEGRKNTDRRFGREADVRWSSFAGDLTVSDRLDLLIRDADAEWPGAFGPRTVFSFSGAAEDDSFGPEWTSLSPSVASELWLKEMSRTQPIDLNAALNNIFDCWKIPRQKLETPKVTPTDRIAAVGPSAIAAVVAAFDAGKDLDFGEQVICVADAPSHRQLAAQAAAFLNAPRKAQLISSKDALSSVKQSLTCIVSADASSTELEIIELLKSGGGE